MDFICEVKSDGKTTLSHGHGPGITPPPQEKAADAIFELSYFAGRFNTARGGICNRREAALSP